AAAGPRAQTCRPTAWGELPAHRVPRLRVALLPRPLGEPAVVRAAGPSAAFARLHRGGFASPAPESAAPAACLRIGCDRGTARRNRPAARTAKSTARQYRYHWAATLPGKSDQRGRGSVWQA